MWKLSLSCLCGSVSLSSCSVSWHYKTDREGWTQTHYNTDHQCPVTLNGLLETVCRFNLKCVKAVVTLCPLSRTG